MKLALASPAKEQPNCKDPQTPPLPGSSSLKGPQGGSPPSTPKHDEGFSGRHAGGGLGGSGGESSEVKQHVEGPFVEKSPQKLKHKNVLIHLHGEWSHLETPLLFMKSLKVVQTQSNAIFFKRECNDCRRQSNNKVTECFTHLVNWEALNQTLKSKLRMTCFSKIFVLSIENKCLQSNKHLHDNLPRHKFHRCG